MDRDKNINTLRDRISEVGKERERPTRPEAPQSIKIGNIGDGATIIIGGDHSVRLSAASFSLTVLIATNCHGGSFRIPMGMSDGRGSTAVQLMLDALVSPGASAILLPAWPTAMQQPFRVPSAGIKSIGAVAFWDQSSRRHHAGRRDPQPRRTLRPSGLIRANPG